MDAGGGWAWVRDYTGTSGSAYERFGFAAPPPSDHRRKCPRVQCCGSSPVRLDIVIEQDKQSQHSSARPPL